MTAIAVMEDLKAAAATALMRTTCLHAATIIAAWSAQYHSETAMVHSEATVLQDLQVHSVVQVTDLTTLTALPHLAVLLPLVVVVLSQVVDLVALSAHILAGDHMVEAHMVAVHTVTEASEAADKKYSEFEYPDLSVGHPLYFVHLFSIIYCLDGFVHYAMSYGKHLLFRKCRLDISDEFASPGKKVF